MIGVNLDIVKLFSVLGGLFGCVLPLKAAWPEPQSGFAAVLPRVLLWELWSSGGVVEPRHKPQCPVKLQARVCICSHGT